MSLYRNFGTVVAFVFLASVGVVSAQSGGPPQRPAGDPRWSTPQPSESSDAPEPDDAAGFTESSTLDQRTEINLLGQTDTGAGESRRNENVQFNLVDNNALKELRVRLGTTATIIEEFKPADGYFGAEFGASPKGPLHMVGSGDSGYTAACMSCTRTACSRGGRSSRSVTSNRRGKTITDSMSGLRVGRAPTGRSTRAGRSYAVSSTGTCSYQNRTNVLL